MGQSGEVRTCGLGMYGLYQSHNTIKSTHYLLIAYLVPNTLGTNFFFVILQWGQVLFFKDDSMDTQKLSEFTLFKAELGI